MKFFSMVFVLCLLNLMSCGSDNGSSSPESVVQNAETELSEGSYAISCFYNKLASQGIGTTIYSKATITLNAGDTGSNGFELYDDAACTNMLNSGTVTILHYETVVVDGTRVLLMDQDDGSGSVTRLWIGYKKAGSAYYVDVDFNDGESGPYLAEPTAAELSAFAANPAAEGISLQKI